MTASEKRGVADAANLLRADIEKVYPPPPTQKGVFARHVPHDRAVPENREGRAMRHLVEEIAERTAAVDKMHADTGARIDAWQELPKESAFAITEARAIAELVEEEIKLIDALRSSLARALHQIKGDNLAQAKRRIEALKDEVERWHRDAEADKAALLVHGKSVIERPPGNGASNVGVVEIPLPVQAQRAMADAIERRAEAEGDLERTKALVFEEQRIQADLEKRLGEAIDQARDSMTSEGVNELRSGLDAVRAWGHSLAFEARRYKPKAG